MAEVVSATGSNSFFPTAVSLYASQGQQNLSCIACRCFLRDQEDQREHYRTEWHRFNLKRKVASLPPVDLATFENRVLEEATSNKSKGRECPVCLKFYPSENAYRSHVQSKKHKEKELKANGNVKAVTSSPHTASPGGTGASKTASAVPGSSNPAEAAQPARAVEPRVIKAAPVDETEEEMLERKIRSGRALSPTDCLFCRQKATDAQSNVDHMAKAHGFFIPDIEYLKDLEGLLTYLGEKVGVGNVCLYCADRSKTYHTVEAVQNHMLDKSHCKLKYEDDDAEYDEYYDFSRSYVDVVGDEGSDDEGSDGSWEVVEDAEEIEGLETSASKGATVATSRRARMDLIVLPKDKGAVDLTADGMELVLADGKVLGHRDYAKFYRQKPRPTETRDAVVINQLIQNYRLLGWQGEASPRAISLHQKIQWQCQRAEDRAETSIAIKNNKHIRRVRRNITVANSGYGMMK